MTVDELYEASEAMGNEERLRRWSECVKGSHSLFVTASNTPQTYCRNCLTLFSTTGIELNPPREV